jgi:membrane-associated protease RseP (regulator of RpoE activity)
MNPTRFPTLPVRLVAALLATCLLFAPGVAASAAETDRSTLERDLAEARKDLEEAAREVADLSRKLYGGEAGEAMRFVFGRPQGSMMGVNIGGDAGRDEGVEVVGVSPGGPAAQAGLRTGDVIVAVDGRALRRSAEHSAGAQLVEYLRSVEPGRVLKVDYLREGKRATASVKAVAAEPPLARMLRDHGAGHVAVGVAPLVGAFFGGHGPWDALELVQVTPKLGQYFGTESGLLVVRAPESTGLSLEEGDVLLTIDGRTPENPGHAFRILDSYQPGEKVKLGVLRQRKRVSVEATIPERPEHGDGFRHPLPPPLPPAPAVPQAPSDAGPA